MTEQKLTSKNSLPIIMFSVQRLIFSTRYSKENAPKVVRRTKLIKN